MRAEADVLVPSQYADELCGASCVLGPWCAGGIASSCAAKAGGGGEAAGELAQEPGLVRRRATLSCLWGVTLASHGQRTSKEGGLHPWLVLELETSSYLQHLCCALA